MVFTMESDGSLSASQSQERFARNYNDGIGQGNSDAPVAIFGSDATSGTNATEEPSDRSFRVTAVAPRVAVPRPDILAGIDETALRYASHQGLRAAGLTVTEWRLLFRSNIEIESAYNPNARSHVGAIGLGQLMPGTADDLGVDPYDWRANLDGSARYLAAQLATFGDARFALAAYNAGPDAVRQYGGIPPYRETQNHVQRVLAVFNRLEGENS
ncbi:lytic transglycosylase domain-containing protein [Loktanella agnita]|uniref:lytic transglycosylase domain-containing protein n=1 Tax=Loktanella agnita TaxID=287097 RepID=UPI0039860D8F